MSSYNRKRDVISNTIKGNVFLENFKPTTIRKIRSGEIYKNPTDINHVKS